MTMKLNWLAYDIPDEVKGNVDDPCGKLRRIALHAQLSVWIIREDLLPLGYLGELSAQPGVILDIVPLDEHAGAQFLEIAVRTLKAELAALTAKKEYQIGENADAIYAKMLEKTNGDREKAFKRVKSHIEWHIKNAEKQLTDFKAAADNYVVDGSRYGLDEAQAALATLKTKVNTRIETFRNLQFQVSELANEGNEGAAGMADALANDSVPVGIALDYAEENGVNVTAAREVFQGVA